VYFDRLRKEMTNEEWDAFIDDTIRDADEVFVHDYDDVEAQIYMKRKMYDHLVKFCMHTSYNAEENLANYAKYMSEADQRQVAQNIIERMKRRAPECRRGDDYDHFASWIKRLAECSPVCKQIAREAAEEIVKENPNKAFKRILENEGVI
jgi:galactose-1-phosphate uridylyltransferase